MAFTSTGGTHTTSTAGDTLSGRLRVLSITTTLNGTGTGSFVFKSAAGTTIFTITDLTVTAGAAPLTQTYNLGSIWDGIEVDSLPTGAIVTICVD